MRRYFSRFLTQGPPRGTGPALETIGLVQRSWATGMIQRGFFFIHLTKEEVGE